MNKHKVGDLVYSNSYGLGWIEDIYPRNSYKTLFDHIKNGENCFLVSFQYNNEGYDFGAREYPEKGIDTMKMFLQMKMRGEDV